MARSLELAQNCATFCADLTAVFEEITGYLEQAVTLPEAGEFLSEGPRDEPVSPLAEAGAPLGQHVFTSITCKLKRALSMHAIFLIDQCNAKLIFLQIHFPFVHVDS